MATCELGLAATMATRWSCKLGELYLRKNGLHGEVRDVEELKVRLWLRGIKQLCSDAVDFLVVADGSPPVAALLNGEDREGMEWEREGGSAVMTRPSHVSARPRRRDASKAWTPCSGSILHRSAMLFD
jgi:hypothetical protein